MATSYTEGNYAAEFIRSCGEGTISFEQVTIATGVAQNLKAGTVLGKITASSKYVLHDNAAADGSQTAVGVLYGPVDATVADQKATALLRLAEVIDSMLVFKTGISAPNRAAALVSLAAANIIAR